MSSNSSNGRNSVSRGFGLVGTTARCTRASRQSAVAARAIVLDGTTPRQTSAPPGTATCSPDSRHTAAGERRIDVYSRLSNIRSLGAQGHGIGGIGRNAGTDSGATAAPPGPWDCQAASWRRAKRQIQDRHQHQAGVAWPEVTIMKAHLVLASCVPAPAGRRGGSPDAGALSHGPKRLPSSILSLLAPIKPPQPNEQ